MILVTGGAGFIGSHIVDAARSRRPQGAGAGLPAGGGPRRAARLPRSARRSSLRATCAIPRRCARRLTGWTRSATRRRWWASASDFGDVADYVSHNDLGTAVLLRAAARRRFAGASCSPAAWWSTARAATAAPARAGRRLRRATPRISTPAGSSHAARSAAASSSPKAVPEGAPLDPRNVYAATKVHQEHLCHAFARETGVTVTALRYHNVYGPRMPRDTPYAGVAAIFASALAAGARRAFRGRPPAARFRPRARCRPRQRARAHARRGRAGRVQRGQRDAAQRGRDGRGARDAPARAPRGRWWSAGSTGSATSATSSPQPSAPGGPRLHATEDFRAGMAEFVGLRCVPSRCSGDAGPPSRSRRDTATAYAVAAPAKITR